MSQLYRLSMYRRYPQLVNQATALSYRTVWTAIILKQYGNRDGEREGQSSQSPTRQATLCDGVHVTWRARDMVLLKYGVVSTSSVDQ